MKYLEWSDIKENSLQIGDCVHIKQGDDIALNVTIASQSDINELVKSGAQYSLAYVDPYRKKNLNFSLAEKTVDKWEEYSQQRMSRGFDDTELWNLDVTIAAYVLPRLEAFEQQVPCHPMDMTEDEWKEIIGKMIFSMRELVIEQTPSPEWNDNVAMREYNEKVQEGLTLFGTYFQDLWW